MNDKALVERVRDREHHFRHALEGEYDANLFMKVRFEIEAQATRIEALEAALRKIESQAVCVAIPATEDEMRDWLQNILETTQQALESQP